MRRDLLAVADLVELCFQDSLDADGRLYIKQMRQSARYGRGLNLSAGATGSADLPSGGYVWIEEGNIIGNLSLIPVRSDGIRRYLIANVAVHPDYRRRGIARTLTEAALEEAGRRKADQTWLQVDAHNEAAKTLYAGMGFMVRAERTTWESKPQPEKVGAIQNGIEVRTQRGADWSQQNAWLQDIYPEAVRWNLPLDLKLFEPGWLGSLQRFLGERNIEQWSAVQDDELLGVLMWQSSSLHADRLWIAAREDSESLALPALLHHTHLNLRLKRPIALNYPAHRSVPAFKEAGFDIARDLIWMQLA
ncbi:MAG: GNAT family N-acetyltransferase [Chloroflexi bacterium]|nr:GNAT family N-acetyltransferase [Chloroflexota bacterium]